MKKQTFISFLEDEHGKSVNFERWSYKRVDTVIGKLEKLYNQYYYVYKNDIKKSKRITIYATPDGYTKENEPVVVIPIEEIIKIEI